MTDERRLTTRILVKWKALSQQGALPRRRDLVPEGFGADCPRCLMIEMAPELSQSRPIFIGRELGGGGWAPDNPSILADYPENSAVALATNKLKAVIAKQAPITFGGTGVLGSTAVLYRAILLPLSDDGDRIDHVIGGVNFKEISAVEEYGDEAVPAATARADVVASYLAFSSRRVAFAPSAAKRTAAITIR
jgi:hypothetical protein